MQSPLRSMEKEIVKDEYFMVLNLGPKLGLSLQKLSECKNSFTNLVIYSDDRKEQLEIPLSSEQSSLQEIIEQESLTLKKTASKGDECNQNISVGVNGDIRKGQRFFERMDFLGYIVENITPELETIGSETVRKTNSLVRDIVVDFHNNNGNTIDYFRENDPSLIQKANNLYYHISSMGSYKPEVIELMEKDIIQFTGWSLIEVLSSRLTTRLIDDAEMFDYLDSPIYADKLRELSSFYKNISEQSRDSANRLLTSHKDSSLFHEKFGLTIPYDAEDFKDKVESNIK